MAKKENQKLKILYLLKIFEEKTDYEHRLTMPQIIRELEKYGVKAERKSLYSDIAILKEFGYDIAVDTVKNRYEYYLAMRQFELPELKLLVDAVQSSKFITERKSNDLIRKLEFFCSSYDAKQLQRQVIVSGRVKTMNESIFRNVDQIHMAIAEDRKIHFQYWNWSIDKKMVLRKDGALYKVSPLCMTWDDENYYLIAFDDEDQIIKHYRVDKIIHINAVNEKRVDKTLYEEINIAEYAKKTFGMYGGEEHTVTIECENSFAGVMIDRFGKDVTMVMRDEEHFAVMAKVAVSPQFIGWIVGLGEDVRVTGPESVVKEIKKEGKRIASAYR